MSKRTRTHARDDQMNRERKEKTWMEVDFEGIDEGVQGDPLALEAQAGRPKVLLLLLLDVVLVEQRRKQSRTTARDTRRVRTRATGPNSRKGKAAKEGRQEKEEGKEVKGRRRRRRAEGGSRQRKNNKTECETGGKSVCEKKEDGSGCVMEGKSGMNTVVGDGERDAERKDHRQHNRKVHSKERKRLMPQSEATENGEEAERERGSRERGRGERKRSSDLNSRRDEALEKEKAFSGYAG